MQKTALPNYGGAAAVKNMPSCFVFDELLVPAINPYDKIKKGKTSLFTAIVGIGTRNDILFQP